MNLKQLLFLKYASGSRELSFTYTLGAYIERFGSDPYVRTACSPFTGSSPNKYAAGYVTNQEYYTIQNKLQDEVNKYPIRFGDANKIILDVPDYIRATAFFVTSLEKTGGYAKFIDGDINPYDQGIPLGKREIVIPEGADSFGFSLFYPDGLITDDIMKSIKVKAVKADWIERLITGNPVSFTPNAERDLLKFDVPLTYSQSGSGDPSPSNVRPITGYSGIGISHFSTNEVVATAAESTSNGLNWKVTADGTVIYNGKPTAYSGRKVGNYYVKGNETIHCYLLGDIDNIKFDDAMIFDESGTRLATVSSGWSGKKTPQNQGTLDLSEYHTAYRVEITVCRNQNNVDMNGVCIPVVGEDLSIPVSYNISFPALGKNLIDDSIKYQYASGTLAIGNQYDFTIPLKAGTYTLSVEFLNGAHYGAFYREQNDGSASTIWSSDSEYSSLSFTIPKDGMYRLWLYKAAGAPAENVGHCQLERAINMLQNKTAVRGATSIYIGQDTADVYPNHLVAGTVYSMSYECDGTRSPQVYIQENGESAVLAGNGKQFAFSPAKTGDYRMYVYVQDGVTSVTNFQLSTATNYEPYINTVYGGTLDVTTGVLTLTHAYRKYVGASGEQWYDNSSHPGCFVTQWAEVKNKGVTACNMSPANNNSGDFPSFGYVYNQNSSYNIRTHLVDEALTVSQFKSWLAEHPFELVCPLINPVTVQLDPVTIQTLIGTNTIWTNTNGSNTIKYLKKEG